MELSNAKRKYLAAICGRSVEFLISIALIGQLVAGHGKLKVFVLGVVVIFLLTAIGTWLTPDD